MTPDFVTSCNVLDFRLLALQELDRKGRLSSLRGMEQKLVTCHIVGDNSAIQANYGALRGNDCQAAFVHAPFVHELVFIVEGLLHQFGKDKVIEAVVRFGKSLSIGHDELTALRKFSAWPMECLSLLTEILKMFQTLQTLDGKVIGKRKTREITSGSIVAVPSILLKKIRKVDVEYFKENASLVIEKQISLKQLAENFSKTVIRNQTAKAVLEMSGSPSMKDIQELYPGKFDNSVLDIYEGALLGETPNIKGESLQEYCRDVFDNKDIGPKARFTNVNTLSEVDLSKFSEYSCIVLNCSELSRESLVQIQTLKSLKEALSVLLLMDDCKEGIEVYKFLDNGQFDLKMIFFTVDNPSVKENMCENVRIGILMTGVIYKTPLMALNGSLSQLEEVVSKLVPPGSSRIAFLNHGNKPMIKVHMKLNCDYYGNKEALERFKKVLGCDVDVMKEFDVSMTRVNEEKELDLSELAGPSGVCNSTMIEPSKDVSVESCNVSEIHEVEPVTPNAEVDQERYRQFIKLLHKYREDKDQAHSLEIGAIRTFFAKAEIKNTFINAEIDACIKKMADENKVMRSDDIVFTL